MSNPSKVPSDASLPFIAPYMGAMDWADGYARLTECWLDALWAVWQPWVDGQADSIRHLAEQSGWPVPQAVCLRGGEQLG